MIGDHTLRWEGRNESGVCYRKDSLRAAKCYTVLSLERYIAANIIYLGRSGRQIGYLLS